MKEGMLGMSAKTVKPVEGSATSVREIQYASWVLYRLGMCVEKNEGAMWFKTSLKCAQYMDWPCRFRICARTRKVILKHLFKRLRQSPCQYCKNEDMVGMVAKINNI